MIKHCKWVLLIWISAISALMMMNAEEIEVSEEAESDPTEQILKYGTETDVITILSDLASEKVGTYNGLLTDVIAETRDPQIVQGVFQLWKATSYMEGLPLGREKLNRVVQDYDYFEPVILEVIAYLVEVKDLESVELLLQMVDNRNTNVAASAVRAIGQIGIDDEKLSAQPLLDQLKSIDRLSEDNLSVALISTLGELRYTKAADELLLIIEDTASPPGQRRIACVSIGKIGREEDYQVVERLYLEADDAMFRAYALAGLAEFSHRDSTPMLVQALKRDPFWRIRLNAAEKLQGNDSDTVQELLRFKADKDPIKQVRMASLKALAASSNAKSHSFLVNYYTNDSKDHESRIECLKYLLEYRIPGAIDAIHEVIEKLWEKDERRFLEFTGRELSFADWDDLGPIYEKMLDHDNWLIVVYSIRGIRRNELGFEDRLNAMDSEGTNERIRRELQPRVP